ncbi:MAG: adenylate/guanylate cyclase domain-containing protein [Jaaginema sp. PMC 1079.18]|nr:adenylate/guanylate cyclase domain-containing protein [Jaaginema sp. PMC 1080.18]MEC4850533.1 adenylate/guanylate cyclase domain-containing protein [Jaaginema sp. PMC 1079.18]MEC4865789.1 adenylate/guanylate cyclase domain-containing protein [Jaaginema sp. PMC 1078.18]
MSKSFSQWLWMWRGVAIAAPGVTLLVVALRFLGLLQFWEWKAYDAYLRSRPAEAVSPEIVIVGLQEEDLHYLGQGAVSDRTYGQLLNKIAAQNPIAIGFDIYRDLPIPPGEDELAQTFRETDNLIGVEKAIGDRRGEKVAPPPILKTAGRVGSNDLILDADNIIRRGLLYLQTPQGETVYSFSLYLALFYLETVNITPEIVAADTQDIWQLGETLFTPLEPFSGGYVWADTQGYQILVNYYGEDFPIVSVQDILEDRLPPNWGRDRLVLIGAVSESFNDRFATPYSSAWLETPKLTPGVEIHAQIAQTIIDAAVSGRPLLRSGSEALEIAWIFGWAFAGAVFAWYVRYLRLIDSQSVALWQQSLFVLIAILTLLGSTYSAILNGWWLPVVPSFLAFVGAIASITGYTAYIAVKLRQTFGRYLNHEVVASLMETPENLKLGGKRQKITILTSDLRGFTALSEHLAPEDVVTVLNLYYQEMLEAIAQYGGTIDKFLGDGMLILFGVPTPYPDHATRAVACALAMQLAMKPVNQRLKSQNLPTLEMGIGINTGECVIGNVGSQWHTEYTAIGDQVNLAFRIETYTTGTQILVAESSLTEITTSAVKVQACQQVQPKGVQHPICICSIHGISGEYNLLLPQQEEHYLPLNPAVDVTFTVVQGKQLSREVYQGRLIELASHGAKIVVDGDRQETIPVSFTNLKLNLPDLSSQEDIYAKVVNRIAPPNQFYVRFTYIHPVIEQQLEELTLAASSP